LRRANAYRWSSREEGPGVTDLLHQGCSYADLIVRSIRRWGDRVAFIDGTEQVTYRAFGERVSRLVQCFAAMGLRKGDGLAQLSANRIDAFAVMAACFCSGVRYSPLHPLGSVEDHAFILEDAGIAALVVDPASFGEKGGELTRRAPGLKHVLTLGPGAYGKDVLREATKHEAAPLNPEVTADDLLFIAYTGGTTGRPKGVAHAHSSIVFNALLTLAEWDWPRDIRMLVAAPITHAAGMMIVPVMLRGGTVIMQPAFDPAGFVADLKRHRATATFLVPTMVYRLLDHPGATPEALMSLELILYGAAPISPTRLAEAVRRFGPIFQQAYAQYEAPNTLTILPQKLHEPDAHPDRLASCGAPIAGMQVKLLDENDQEVAAGEVGEICARGPLVMTGYWKREEANAETLRNGWLHTGDMAYADADGFLYLVDRKKDMIISGGFNVYPREIEDVLTSHPGVAAAAVIGVPDEKWGEAVKAVVVKRAGTDVEADALIALVRERKGAVYAPKSVDFADAIPVTAIGKPDKKALRARYWGEGRRQVN
jgi:fatty-acyl-CoA synthase